MKVPFNEEFRWKSITLIKNSKLMATCKETRQTFIFSGNERVSIEIEDTEEETKESIWNFYLQQTSSNNIYSTTIDDDLDDDDFVP